MTPAPVLALGLALTAAAGMLDAIGFIELGGYFTSFMSGNTTQLGTALAEPALLLTPLGLIAMFFLGSVAGTLAARPGDPFGSARALLVVLAALAVTLVLMLLAIPPQQSLLPVAFAAGAQNAAIAQPGAARIGATFVTGTLFAAGQDLARALRREVPPTRWLQHVMVWAALLAGAAIGALAYLGLALWALLLPAAIYVAAFIRLGFPRRH